MLDSATMAGLHRSASSIRIRTTLSTSVCLNNYWKVRAQLGGGAIGKGAGVGHRLALEVVQEQGACREADQSYVALSLRMYRLGRPSSHPMGCV